MVVAVMMGEGKCGLYPCRWRSSFVQKLHGPSPRDCMESNKSSALWTCGIYVRA